MHGHVSPGVPAAFQFCICIHAPLTWTVLLAVVLFRAVSTYPSYLDCSGRGHVSPAVCRFTVLFLYTRSFDLDRSSGRGAFPCCLYMLLRPRLSFWPWPRKSSRLQLFSSVSLYTLLWPGPCHRNLGRQHLLLGRPSISLSPILIVSSRSGPIFVGWV